MVLCGSAILIVLGPKYGSAIVVVVLLLYCYCGRAIVVVWLYVVCLLLRSRAESRLGHSISTLDSKFAVVILTATKKTFLDTSV